MGGNDAFQQYNHQLNSRGGGLRPQSLGAAAYEENNMLKEFVDRLIGLADPVFREEDDGRVYSSRTMNPLEPPMVMPVQLQTLAGFVDLYKLLDSTEQPTIIHVLDYQQVWLMSKKVDPWNRRSALAKAGLPTDFPRFRFGQWMDPEEFVIGLMTLFEDAEYGIDHKKIVRLVSGLAAEAVTISNDDGISQQVVTRQGMVNKSEEKVSPRVDLSPFRTFREVSQPMSKFILRLRSRQGQMPSCALFEADGGEWKNDAIKSIKEYFAKELPEANIIA